MNKMKYLAKLVLVLFVGLLLTGSGFIATAEDTADPWVAFDPTPKPVYMPAFAQCPGDHAAYYLIGGMTDKNEILDTLWRYDASEDHWRELKRLPIPLVGAAATCYGGKIYVAGGVTTELILTSWASDVFLVYDIARDSWEYGPRLARRVWGAGLGAWKGKLYLFGGTSINFLNPWPIPKDKISDAQVDVLNLDGLPWWVPRARTAMPFPATHFGWVQSGRNIYVAGGRISLSHMSRITQRYDIERNYWSRGPDIPAALHSPALVNSESHLHLIGGFAPNESPRNIVLSLEKRYWPKGDWDGDLIDALHAPLYGVVGFCTEVGQENAIWAVGGLTNGDVTVDTNQCHAVANCFVDPDASEE